MIRGIGFLLGPALIFAGIGQAILRDWTIDGLFLLLCGLGLLALLMALVAETGDHRRGRPPLPRNANPKRVETPGGPQHLNRQRSERRALEWISTQKRRASCSRDSPSSD